MYIIEEVRSSRWPRLLIAGVVILVSVFTIVISSEVGKSKNVYKSKATEVACKEGLTSIASNINIATITANQQFECRVNATDGSFTDVICGYQVNGSWPKNCSYVRTEGNIIIFQCNPTQPVDDSIPLPQSGDAIKLVAMRGNQIFGSGLCKTQWGNQDLFISGPTLSYISQSSGAPTQPPAPGNPTQPPNATLVVGNCGTAPIPTTADTRYKWTALCNGADCQNDSSKCPTGANGVAGWCYGFDSGFRCLQYQGIDAASSLYVDVSGATTTVIATATQRCSTNITNPPESNGYNNCRLSGGNTCSGGNPKDSKSCWWQWTCATGQNGARTASFRAANDSQCESRLNFNVNVGASAPTAVPTVPPQATNTPIPATSTPIPPTAIPTGRVCAQVITSARNRANPSECREFPNACIPEGWERVDSCPANVLLKLRLKFQGITSVPVSRNYMDVKVIVRKAGVEVTQILGLVADENGVWSRDPALFPGLPAGSGYSILIKGPRHLQRKICNLSPSESVLGLYQCRGEGLTLNAGIDELNFTGITLLAGDLDQNGVANAADIARILTNLGSTDSNILRVADVNLDGVINTQDFSLVVDALSVKVDEE